MRIVFFGEDSFSAVVLESLILANHKVVAVICPFYENNTHSRLKLVSEKNIIHFKRFKDINSEEVQNLLEKLNPDLIAVCHFQKILNKNIIDIPKLGCINLHPSLLPNYRGMAPQHWPIINGDDETGITVHFINEGVDTGDIILQKKISIDSDIYVSNLQRNMLSVYQYIMKESIDLISKNEVNFTKQNHLMGSYYGRLKESQCVININNGFLEAYNLIRGVSMPYYGAKFCNFRIWKASIAEKKINDQIKQEFKTNGIYFDSKWGDFIKFADGSLIIGKYNKIEKHEK